VDGQGDIKMRRFFKVYGRALGFLGAHRWTVAGLCAANLALTAVGFLEPMLFGNVVQGLSDSHPESSNIMIWAAAGLMGIVAGIATSLAGDRLAHRVRLHVLRQAYAHTLRLPSSYHAEHPTGGLMKTLWAGADEMFSLWLNLFREHLSTVLCLVGLIPVALFINPALGSILVALALVFSATVSLTLHRTRDGQRHAENAHTAMSAQVSDVLGNARLIQAFGVAPREIASFGPMATEVLRHQLPVLGWWAGMTVMSRAASTVATVTVLCLGAWLHGLGRASMAEIVTFMGFSGMLIGRLETAVTTVSRLGATVPRLEDFFAMLDTNCVVHDRVALPELPAGPGAVEFRGVRFAYSTGAPVLDGVDFTAKPGETVALVGATGSGKSTAMALLQRLWDPAEGTVLVDGHDVQNVSLDSLRDRIGVVPQETLLLNRTIGENLRIGRPDATREEMEHAARLAEAHDFIMRQPQGYDTIVGERGASLSGGQRQRLAIARALLRDPAILILDEATSALDGLTEEKVVRAMKAAASGRTTFVIAHRLATIRDADRVLFFRDGVVAESGTFEELVARDGAFAELARTQFPAPERPAGVPNIRLVYSRAEAGDRHDGDDHRAIPAAVVGHGG
jgi:ATP-binding cassette, subfamily B, beta-glucan exporter